MISAIRTRDNEAKRRIVRFDEDDLDHTRDISGEEHGGELPLDWGKDDRVPDSEQ